GLSPDLPVMRAIGVPEIAALVREECSKEEAIAAGAQSTRQYAKRQFTWMRNQCPSDWVRNESENIDILDHFALLLQD
ncbi:MAG: tRNA (adenosine(37)-N6)-dimethylallyltransferase MiaA, partial [Pseudomonadota bacterium]